MPKNYQISQYDLPICVGGHLDVELAGRLDARVGITRVHMEEDTGKTTHGSASGGSTTRPRARSTSTARACRWSSA